MKSFFWGVIGLCLLWFGGTFYFWSHLSLNLTAQELKHLEVLLTESQLEEPFQKDGFLLCFFGPHDPPCPWTSSTLKHDLKLARETKSTVVNLRQGYLLKPQGDRLLLLKIPRPSPAFPPWFPFFFLLGGMACLLLSYVYRQREQKESKACWSWLANWTGKKLKGRALFEAAERKDQEIRRELVTLENELWRLRREREELQRKLRKMEEDLTMVQQTLLQTGSLTALGEFAAAISHELNNPLGIILGFTQHLLEEIPPDHPHYPKLKRIETELERCRRIIQDLLAFARPAPPQIREIDLNDFLEGLIRFTFFEKPTGVQVECFLEEGLPKVSVDPEQLEQVLLNLIKNALEAMEGKGRLTIITRLGHLTRRDCFELALPTSQPGALELLKPPEGAGRVPQLKTEYQPGDPAVIIEIRDTGPGIPKEIQEKIFNPFFTTKKGGTGLGLSISWKLIRRNGGLLRYQSVPGQGTTFQIILPVSKERGDGGKTQDLGHR